MCGGPEQTLINKGDLVEFPGFGFIPCGESEQSGLDGVIPAGRCDYVRDLTLKYCTCGPNTGEQEVKVKRNFSEGIFELLPDGMPIDRPRGNAPYSPMFQTAFYREQNEQRMFDQFTDPVRNETLSLMYNQSTATVTRMFIRDSPYYQKYGANVGEPSSVLYPPVVDPRSPEKTLIG